MSNETEQFEKVYVYVPLKYAKKDIENAEVKVSRIKDLDDPFEFEYGIRDDAMPIEMVYRRCFLNRENDKSGYLCFSTCPKGILLWSLYADKHMGAVLELEVDKNGPIQLFDVKYEENRPNVNSVLQGRDKDIVKQLVETKFKGWNFEKERRAVVDLHKCEMKEGQYFVHLSPQFRLKGVYLGCRVKMACFNDVLTIVLESICRHGKNIFANEVHVTKFLMSNSKYELSLMEDDRGHKVFNVDEILKKCR